MVAACAEPQDFEVAGDHRASSGLLFRASGLDQSVGWEGHRLSGVGAIPEGSGNLQVAAALLDRAEWPP